MATSEATQENNLEHKESLNFLNNPSIDQAATNTMEDNADEMDEIWNRLRAHDKKQNSVLTAPAI